MSGLPKIREISKPNCSLFATFSALFLPQTHTDTVSWWLDVVFFYTCSFSQIRFLFRDAASNAANAATADAEHKEEESDSLLNQSSPPKEESGELKELKEVKEEASNEEKASRLYGSCFLYDLPAASVSGRRLRQIVAQYVARFVQLKPGAFCMSAQYLSVFGLG